MPCSVGRHCGTTGTTSVRPQTVDAVVIGAGHNGLVSAAMLADAGWDVVVLEAQSEPGGAVKSAELFPGYVSDLYSAFYPLSVASPALQSLNLEDHGLRWTHAPAVVGHPRSADDEDAPVIHREIDRTAEDLERRTPGDGDRWRALFEQWLEVKDALLATLFAPFPLCGARRSCFASSAQPRRYGWPTLCSCLPG